MVVEYISENDTLKSNSEEVEVTLLYEGRSLKFPINPDNLKEEIESNSTTENIESIGQISIPQRPSLSTMTFSSFFWGDRDTINPKEYVRWIKNWQKSRKPARFVVSSLDWDMWVTCESFSHWVNAGEENDIYFTITLMEYRKYGAKQVKLVGNQYILDEDGIQTVVGVSNVYTGGSKEIAFSEQVTNRLRSMKGPVPYSVTTGDDESIVSLVRRYSPDGNTYDWKAIYNDNKHEVAEAVTTTIEAGEIVYDMESLRQVGGFAIWHPIKTLRMLLEVMHPTFPNN